MKCPLRRIIELVEDVAKFSVCFLCLFFFFLFFPEDDIDRVVIIEKTCELNLVSVRMVYSSIFDKLDLSITITALLISPAHLFPSSIVIVTKLELLFLEHAY